MLERDLIDDVVDRPDWMRDAACREHPEISFFPTRGEDLTPAKEVCRGCLCRAECLDYALEHRVVGVWAGTGERDRQRLRRARRQAA